MESCQKLMEPCQKLVESCQNTSRVWSQLLLDSAAIWYLFGSSASQLRKALHLRAGVDQECLWVAPPIHFSHSLAVTFPFPFALIFCSVFFIFIILSFRFRLLSLPLLICHSLLCQPPFRCGWGQALLWRTSGYSGGQWWRCLDPTCGGEPWVAWHPFCALPLPNKGALLYPFWSLVVWLGCRVGRFINHHPGRWWCLLDCSRWLWDQEGVQMVCWFTYMCHWQDLQLRMEPLVVEARATIWQHTYTHTLLIKVIAISLFQRQINKPQTNIMSCLLSFYSTSTGQGLHQHCQHPTRWHDARELYWCWRPDAASAQLYC